MKGFVIFLIVIAVIILAVGGGFFAIGMVNKSNNPIVTTTYNLDDEDFSDIEIDIATSDLEIVKSSDSSKKVVCKETEKEKHYIEVIAGTLSIKRFEAKKWYEKLFDFTMDKKVVTIYLPEEEYHNLFITASTGKIFVSNDFTFNKVNIKLTTGILEFQANAEDYVRLESSTGEINVKNVECQSLNVTATTGNVSLIESYVHGSAQINISTGNIKTQDFKSYSLKATASTGKVSLVNTVIKTEIDINTSTGDVVFEKSDAETLKIETTTGNVKGSLLSAKIFSTSTSTGHVNVQQSTTGGLCEIKTTTGDITIAIEK